MRSRSRTAFWVGAAVYFAAASAAALPDAIASYTLSARLDTDAHRVDTTGSIRWKNASTRAVSSIWFHLYLNAFKNDETLFLRSPFVRGRGGRGAREFGYIDIERLSIPELGNADLMPRLAQHSPGDPADQTDLELKLPSEIAPGQTVTIELGFKARLPEIVERTGHNKDFYLVAQWFPKVARLEPDGTWHNFAFHPQAEFYADYGNYAVTIDVPQQFQIGASGRAVKILDSGGRHVVRYEVEAVHDFAWTAWDRFRKAEASIEGVWVQLLYPPGQQRNAENTLDALRFALPDFSRRYGAYPYPVLTVVHPPQAAKDAGGMEYPTLITTGGPWYSGLLGARSVEAVTIHELGHQWFYGLVASDEASWPFLDEGLTSYAEGLALEAHYGKGSLFSAWGIELGEPEAMRAFAMLYGRDEPVAQSAASFSGFQSLGGLVYGRTATILHTLAGVWGKERVDRALGRYAREQRFLHPEPRELLSTIEREVGSDAAAFAQRALFERGHVDYLVRSVDFARAAQPAGTFDDDAGHHDVEPKPEGESYDWQSRIVVVRRGSLELEVEVDLIDDEGKAERRSWDGHGAFTAFEHRGPRPIVAAVVDPERRIWIDDNLINNALSGETPGVERVRERSTYLAELLFALVMP